MLCMLLLISLAQMSYPGGRRGRISSSLPTSCLTAVTDIIKVSLWFLIAICFFTVSSVKFL